MLSLAAFAVAHPGFDGGYEGYRAGDGGSAEAEPTTVAAPDDQYLTYLIIFKCVHKLISADAQPEPEPAIAAVMAEPEADAETSVYYYGGYGKKH